MQAESIVLHSTKNGADKIYAIQLKEDGAGWRADAQYGRRLPGDGYGFRGKQVAPLTNNQATTYAIARKAYWDKMAEQQAKGYVIVEQSNGDSAEAAAANAAQAASIAIQMHTNPMLLIALATEEEALRYCRNPSWMSQEKKDGERRLLKMDGDAQVTFINRKDQATTSILKIDQAARNIGHRFLLDGEEIGDTEYAFDLLEYDGQDLRGTPAKARWQQLAKIVALTAGDGIRVVETAFSTQDKLDMFYSIKDRGGEGIVFKMVGAIYEAGLSKKALKFKFKARQTFLCAGQNGTKRSVAIWAPAGEGALCDEMINIGNVTIPANHEIPSIGDAVEVEYLYAFPNGGSLFQPVYKGVRTDVGGVGGTKISTILDLKYVQSAHEEDEEA